MALLLAVLLGLLFGVMARRLRFLNRSGAVAGGLLAASIVGFGGWAWALPALAFFVSSSLLSALGKERKRAAALRSEKGAVRDAGQVLANGGVAWALLVLYAVWPDEAWYWGFLGAFAAAAADTWATEVGTLWRGRPLDLRTGRRVPPGTSGAVSLPGTLGALAGAAVVALAAWPVAEGPFDAPGTLAALSLVTGSGLAGAFTDSLLGATLQARYCDATTGEETERPASQQGRPHRLVRGWRSLTNDSVNALCTLTGALLAMLGAATL